MPFVPSRLRQAAFAAAALFSVLAPSAGGSAVTAAAIGVTAATVMIASDAEARERVRDHRSRRCIPAPHRACPR
jgi:hypothetical protein